MPQFLRSVRILCALHKYYLDAVRVESSSSPVINPVPVSPLSTSVPNSSLQHPVSTVRRAGSFGSLLDSPRNRGGSGRLKLLSSRGHRRSRSQGVPPRSGVNSTLCDSDTSPSSLSRSHSDSISSPFEELEVVWGSLESWFDLLIIEVQKLGDKKNEVVAEPRQHILELELGSAAKLVSNPAQNVASSHSPTNGNSIPDVSVSSAAVCGEHSDSNSPGDRAPDSFPHRKPPKLQLPLVQSSQLAAAIVNSAPQERRAIYLKSSSSFDIAEPTFPLVRLSDMAHKRRSWHVERVAARILTLGGGGSLTSLTAFSRSLSSDSTTTERQSTFVVQT